MNHPMSPSARHLNQEAISDLLQLLSAEYFIAVDRPPPPQPHMMSVEEASLAWPHLRPHTLSLSGSEELSVPRLLKHRPRGALSICLLIIHTPLLFVAYCPSVTLSWWRWCTCLLWKTFHMEQCSTGMYLQVMSAGALVQIGECKLSNCVEYRWGGYGHNFKVFKAGAKMEVRVSDLRRNKLLGNCGPWVMFKEDHQDSGAELRLYSCSMDFCSDWMDALEDSKAAAGFLQQPTRKDDICRVNSGTSCKHVILRPFNWTVEQTRAVTHWRSSPGGCLMSYNPIWSFISELERKKLLWWYPLSHRGTPPLAPAATDGGMSHLSSVDIIVVSGINCLQTCRGTFAKMMLYILQSISWMCPSSWKRRGVFLFLHPNSSGKWSLVGRGARAVHPGL